MANTNVPGTVYPYPPVPGAPVGVGTFFPTHQYTPVTPFNGHATLANNLVSYWKLNEESGVRYDSVTASANDLTDNNTVTSAAGMSGLAAEFTADNSEFLSQTYVITADADVTLSGWIKFTNATGDFSILHSGNYNFDLRLTNGIPQFLVEGSATAAAGAITLSINTWYFIAAWHDSIANTANIVVNADAVASRATVGPNGATTQFSFGRINGLAGYWGGNFDEFGLWLRVLTAQERTDRWASGVGLFY